jgi:hypothetical protein
MFKLLTSMGRGTTAFERIAPAHRIKLARAVPRGTARLAPVALCVRLGAPSVAVGGMGEVATCWGRE